MHLPDNTSLQNGRYIIKRMLGQGGFGITYLAEQGFLKKQFAIKEFFLRNLCTRKEGTKMTAVTQTEMMGRYKDKFIKEAQIIALFDHPNIVKVTDFFYENNTVYYVMDYVEGKSLSAIISEKGSLAEREALGYIRKVAAALDYIHAHNVNHLDLKPANIMIRDVDGEPIVIDFGVSKQYDEKKDQTSTTPPGITEGYSPMEQYRAGGVSTFSPQSDIYALGATLFKMVTGATPPMAPDVLNDGLPPFPASVSKTLSHAIEEAMNPKKNDRPANVKAFMALLSSHNEEETVIMPKAPSSEATVLIPPPISPSPPKLSLNEHKREIIQNLINNMVFVEGDNQTDGNNISSFYLGRYLVTQKEWHAVMDDNPSFFRGDNNPVENVSYNDCLSFISKLSEISGKKFRLPSNDEWKYAAQGGCKRQNNEYKYIGSNEIDEVAWFYYNSLSTTHEVGKKKPNELDLYDMSGNVWEYCVLKTAQDVTCVVRGGSWNSISIYCSVSSQLSVNSEYKDNTQGLRLAL